MENFLNEQQWKAVTKAIKELSEEDRPSACWHYTTLSALNDIIKNSRERINHFGVNYFNTATFWASNIRYLNDEQEFKDGISKLREYKYDDVVDKCMDNVYLISFCGDGDLLSQWKYYGKESGIAVKLNFDCVRYKYWKEVKQGSNLDDPLFLIAKVTPEEQYDDQTRPIKVKYEDRKKKNYYKMLKNMQAIRNAPSLIPNLFVPFCKHSGFSEENESRLVFYAHQFGVYKIGDNIIVPDIVYNLGKSTVKPALQVHMKAETEKNLIDQIVVGPGYNQNLVFNALIHMFDRSNYHFFDIDDPIPEDKIKKSPSLEAFLEEKSDYLVHRVDIETQNGKPKNRLAYKCENGIVIMKSSIPFRGN